MTSQFIDRIYECAIVPELWPGVLADLATLADAGAGTIFAANAVQGIVRWSTSPNLHDKMAAYVAGGWYLADKRRERVVAARHAGFLTEENFFTAEEFESDPTVQGFYRLQGFGRTAITMILLPTGDGLALSVEREIARGPVEPEFIRQLDDLRPHLARSALLSARLQLERARAVTEALGLIGLPALVFNGQGVVLAANPMIESQTSHVRWRARDRVSLKDPCADAQFRQAVAQIDREPAATVGSFVLRNDDALPAAVAHVVPIRRSARDVFTQSAGILMMTPVARPNAPPVELIQSLFDLTAAEARVARGLAAGDTVEQIATTGGVSTNTVRTQVRGVLEKTGSQRQADVIALLAGLQIPRPM